MTRDITLASLTQAVVYRRIAMVVDWGGHLVKMRLHKGLARL